MLHIVFNNIDQFTLQTEQRERPDRSKRRHNYSKTTVKKKPYKETYPEVTLVSHLLFNKVGHVQEHVIQFLYTEKILLHMKISQENSRMCVLGNGDWECDRCNGDWECDRWNGDLGM